MAEMAISTAVQYSYFPPKFVLPPKQAVRIKSTSTTPAPPDPPPIFVSTNPIHINLHHLRELYSLCSHSCHRFPNIDTAGKVEPVDLIKLRTAVSHSSVVVSAFTRPEILTTESSISNFNSIGGQWIRKMAPVTPENGQMIGFGRAVTDCALTASIYDVMVHPSLQGRGIGRMIVQRIIRMLTNKDIYDIAALCTDREKPFFKACGFGDDMLGSTTMMYTRAPSSSHSKDEKMISAGRKLLLVPYPRKLPKQ